MIYQTNNATSDNQATEIADLDAINTSLANVSTATNQTAGNTTLASILTALNSLVTTEGGESSTLSSILTALSTLATASAQTAGNTTLSSIDSKIGSTTGTVSSLAMTTASQTALSASATRRGFYLYNASNKTVYISYAATSSTSLYTFPLPMNSGYESPQMDCYRGVISVIGAATISGNLLITDLH